MTLLHLQQVSFQFPETAKQVLHQINYEVKTGDCVILLGSNGSGKSSLLKLIHRDYQPGSGNIHLLGYALNQLSDQRLSQHLAVLTQSYADSLFPALTIYENFLLINQSKQKKCPTDKHFLANFLRNYNPNLVHKLDSLVDQLSGGEKQALALAFCLIQPPSLLLLDEHTSALDPNTSDQIMQLTQRMIVQHHITCLLTTHDLDIALRYGNRILMLKEGRIHHTIDHQDKMHLTKERLIQLYY